MGSNSHAPAAGKLQVLGPKGPLLTNRMSELFTYGSVGGVGGNSGPYPAAAEALPHGGPHPLPQRTGRNAQLLLSGSRVNYHFQGQPSFLVATQPPKWWVEESNFQKWHFELSLLRYVPTEV